MADPDTAAFIRREREQGIGCETCHGGAKQWVTVHYQRDISRQRLLELGMVDTRNLLVRARLCASCHVGSAENDMNHDMIAAGHPPLRFELASYEALIPQKHWDDRSRRAADPNYEIQLWAAGRVASAEAALAVLEGRARRAEQRSEVGGQRSGVSMWPEFAESNCFSCHQPMRSQAGVTSMPTYRGVAAWQSWNLALINPLVAQRSTENELPPAAFDSSLAKLRAAMEESFEPPGAQIAALAATTRQSLRSSVRIDAAGQVLDSRGQPLNIRAALEAAAVDLKSASWDDVCQQTAALAASRRAISDTTGETLPNVQQQLKSAAASLRFMRADREWPAALANQSNMMSISQELESIRQDLLRVAPESPRRAP